MRIEVQQVKNSAQGRWHGIFSALGIEVPENGQHGPCPIEGNGKDRFRCDNKDGHGTWICTNCGAGDGISLVRQCLGLSFGATLSKISEIVGMGIASVIEKEPDFDPKKSLNSLWKASVTLTGGDPVTKYLHSRGLVLTPENVRYCPECFEPDTKKKYPAMIARLVDSDGIPVSIHRTYLGENGKASIEKPRKLMKGTKHLAGSCVRLFQPKDNTIGIAEGIETAIAAYQVTNMPCWASLNTALMKSFVPPQGIRHVVIFGDADAHFAGHVAAYTLANRLYNKDLLVEVEFPPIGKDFNDYLMLKKEKSDENIHSEFVEKPARS